LRLDLRLEEGNKQLEQPAVVMMMEVQYNAIQYNTILSLLYYFLIIYMIYVCRNVSQLKRMYVCGCWILFESSD